LGYPDRGIWLRFWNSARERELDEVAFDLSTDVRCLDFRIDTMNFPNRPVDAIEGWHAHIYYDPQETKVHASILRDQIGEKFPNTRVGSWHDEAVGPHLVSMYQVAFDVSQFDRLVPWLALNRNGLNVLIHPHTENAWNDHMIFGFWLGERLPLNEDRLLATAVRVQRG
jgi:aromatic ring-cleaving dioxygenase